MKISIIIVAYNHYNDLKNCIDSISLYSDLGDELEIIVVDNSPNIDLYDRFKQEYPHIVIVKNNQNGFGRANNIGANLSKGEILLFLNPDTLLVKPLFSSIYDQFSNDNSLGLCGIRLLDEELKPNLSFYWLDNTSILAQITIKWYNKRASFDDKKMFISGACMFIRKGTFFDIGGFDEKIFMYVEERDITRRLLSKGWTIKYFPQYEVIHLEGGTTGDSLWSFQQRIISNIYYSRKYGFDFKRKYNHERNLLLIKTVTDFKNRKEYKAMLKYLKQKYKEYVIGGI